MFLLGFARLTRTSTFTSLAVYTAHVSGGKRLPPSRANTANSAIIRRENRLTRGVLWTRHKFSSSLRRKRPAPMAGTAGYRSLRSLYACLAVFIFEIKGKLEHRRPLSAPRRPRLPFAPPSAEQPLVRFGPVLAAAHFGNQRNFELHNRIHDACNHFGQALHLIRRNAEVEFVVHL